MILKRCVHKLHLLNIFVFRMKLHLNYLVCTYLSPTYNYVYSTINPLISTNIKPNVVVYKHFYIPLLQKSKQTVGLCTHNRILATSLWHIGCHIIYNQWLFGSRAGATAAVVDGARCSHAGAVYADTGPHPHVRQPAGFVVAADIHVAVT